MDECGIALDAAVPACNDTFELVKLDKGTFDLPTPTVATQRAPIMGRSFNSVALMRCNQFNTAMCQRLIEQITVVGTIPDKSSGLSHGDGCIEGSFDKGDFMWTSRSRMNDEWKAIP
ncbi:MAG: hypothetical protein JWO67_7415 [Streptosporangiaceae bacterium]|nr:hypothetical protein [Streptosporangiaceae bacterium]